MILAGLGFFRPVHCLTAHCLIKINLVSVKFRPLDAGKPGFATDRHTARAAHSGTIDHKGVEADSHGDSELAAGECGEFHHYHRSYRHAAGVLLPFCHQSLEFCGTYTVESHRTVIGAQVKIVGNGSYLFSVD